MSAEGHKHSPYLDLDGPWEITDVDIKGDIGVASKGELLTGETVSVFLDVSFGHDRYFLSRDGSSCWGKKFVFSTLSFGDHWVPLHTEMELDQLQRIIMNPLLGLSSHLGQRESSHEQLLLCLKCITLLFGWPKTVELYCVIAKCPYFIVKWTWTWEKSTAWKRDWNAAVHRS